MFHSIFFTRKLSKIFYLVAHYIWQPFSCVCTTILVAHRYIRFFRRSRYSKDLSTAPPLHLKTAPIRFQLEILFFFFKIRIFVAYNKIQKKLAYLLTLYFISIFSLSIHTFVNLFLHDSGSDFGVLLLRSESPLLPIDDPNYTNFSAIFEYIFSPADIRYLQPIDSYYLLMRNR